MNNMFKCNALILNYYEIYVIIELFNVLLMQFQAHSKLKEQNSYIQFYKQCASNCIDIIMRIRLIKTDSKNKLTNRLCVTF